MTTVGCCVLLGAIVLTAAAIGLSGRRDSPILGNDSPAVAKLHIQHNGRSHPVLVGLNSEPSSVIDAVAAAVGVPVVAAATLMDMQGRQYTRYGRSVLRPGGQYKIEVTDGCGTAKAKGNISALLTARENKQVPATPVRVLGGTSASLPRVMMASVGVGSQRSSAVAALRSAYEYFGEDCILSLHLLTDDVEDIPVGFNPKQVAPHERTVGDRLAFRDVAELLQVTAESTDYFFFLAPDARFVEATQLAEVSADLAAAEHPYYPRDEMGLCKPRTPDGRVQSVTRQICELPFSRDSTDGAFVPSSFGKFWRKGKKKHKDGHNMVFLVSTATYFYSGFWGGRSTFAADLARELASAVAKDMQANRAVPTAEMYFNAAMWRRSNSSLLNIRRLTSSFAYPANPIAADLPWLTHKQRPVLTANTIECGLVKCAR